MFQRIDVVINDILQSIYLILILLLCENCNNTEVAHVFPFSPFGHFVKH